MRWDQDASPQDTMIHAGKEASKVRDKWQPAGEGCVMEDSEETGHIGQVAATPRTALLIQGEALLMPLACSAVSVR